MIRYYLQNDSRSGHWVTKWLRTSDNVQVGLIRGGWLGLMMCPFGYFSTNMKKMDLVATFSRVFELFVDSKSDLPAVMSRPMA